MSIGPSLTFALILFIFGHVLIRFRKGDWDHHRLGWRDLEYVLKRYPSSISGAGYLFRIMAFILSYVTLQHLPLGVGFELVGACCVLIVALLLSCFLISKAFTFIFHPKRSWMRMKNFFKSRKEITIRTYYRNRTDYILSRILGVIAYALWWGFCAVASVGVILRFS